MINKYIEEKYNTKLLEFTELKSDIKSKQRDLISKANTFKNTIKNLEVNKGQLEKQLKFDKADQEKVKIAELSNELQCINERISILEEIIKNGNDELKQKSRELEGFAKQYKNELKKARLEIYETQKAERIALEEKISETNKVAAQYKFKEDQLQMLISNMKY